MITTLVPLLCSRAFLKRQTGHEHEQQCEEERSKDGSILRTECATGNVSIGGWRYCYHEDGWKTISHVPTSRVPVLTELYNDLSKVVRMSCPGKEANITHFALVLWIASEQVLLNVGYAFEDETDSKEYDTRNIPSSSKRWLVKFGHVRRIKNGDRQRNSPDPDHLENPEAKEGPELIALVVKAVIFTGLDDSEEEEAGKPCAPEHDEQRADDLAGMMMARECKCDDREDDKVCTASKVYMRRLVGAMKKVDTALPVSLSNLRLNAMLKKNSW